MVMEMPQYCMQSGKILRDTKTVQLRITTNVETATERIYKEYRL